MEARAALFSSGQAVAQPSERPVCRALPVALPVRRHVGKRRERNTVPLSSHRKPLPGQMRRQDAGLLIHAPSAARIRQESAPQRTNMQGNRLAENRSAERSYAAICIADVSSVSKAGCGSKFFSRPHWFDLLMGTDQVRRDIIQGKQRMKSAKPGKKSSKRTRR